MGSLFDCHTVLYSKRGVHVKMFVQVCNRMYSLYGHGMAVCYVTTCRYSVHGHCTVQFAHAHFHFSSLVFWRSKRGDIHYVSSGVCNNLFGGLFALIVWSALGGFNKTDQVLYVIN